MRNSGFTLAEIAFATCLLGVMAMLSVPVYSHYMTQSQASEAVSNLKLIRSAESMYFLKNRKYWPSDDTQVTNVSVINSGLNIDIPSPKFYNLSVRRPTGGSEFH